jgi:hypothetical protein
MQGHIMLLTLRWRERLGSWPADSQMKGSTDNAVAAGQAIRQASGDAAIDRAAESTDYPIGVRWPNRYLGSVT